MLRGVRAGRLLVDVLASLVADSETGDERRDGDEEEQPAEVSHPSCRTGGPVESRPEQTHDGDRDDQADEGTADRVLAGADAVEHLLVVLRLGRCHRGRHDGGRAGIGGCCLCRRRVLDRGHGGRVGLGGRLGIARERCDCRGGCHRHRRQGVVLARVAVGERVQLALSQRRRVLRVEAVDLREEDLTLVEDLVELLVVRGQLVACLLGGIRGGSRAERRGRIHHSSFH